MLLTSGRWNDFKLLTNIDISVKKPYLKSWVRTDFTFWKVTENKMGVIWLFESVEKERTVLICKTIFTMLFFIPIIIEKIFLSEIQTNTYLDIRYILKSQVSSWFCRTNDPLICPCSVLMVLSQKCFKGLL